MNLNRAIAAVIEKRREPRWNPGRDETSMSPDEAQRIVQEWMAQSVYLDVWFLTSHRSTPAVRIRAVIRDLSEVTGKHKLTFFEPVKGSFLMIDDSFVQDASRITAEPAEAGNRLTFYYARWVLRLSEYSDEERAVPS